MSRRHPLLTFAVAFGVVAAACTGGSDADDDNPFVDGRAAEEATASDGVDTSNDADEDSPDDPDGDQPTPAPADTAPVEAIASTWLASTSGFDPELVSQLAVREVIPAGPVSHVRFDQIIDERRVSGSTITVHVLANGDVQGANESLVTASPRSASMLIDEAAAVAIAVKAVDGTIEGTPTGEAVWAQVGDELVPSWLVSLSTVNPGDSFQITIDGVTSGILTIDRGTQSAHGYRRTGPDKIGGSVPVPVTQVGDACAAPAAPSACVFFNPVAASGSPVDPRNANDFLTGVRLPGLTSSDQLTGRFVDVAFDGSPHIPDPEADGTWAGGIGSRNFEGAMTYFWIDRTQRLYQDLGFAILDDAPIEVVALDSDEVDNAFFLFEDERIRMGVGSNGIHAAQDASVTVHEYGHATFHDQVGFDTHVSSYFIAAYSEAFGDILAGLTSVELRADDPACLGGWFVLTNDCLRRLDGDKVFPQDVTNEVHDDGEIFVGAVWAIFEGLLAQDGLTTDDCFGGDACIPARDRLLSVALGSHYYVAPGADFLDIANAYLLANESGFADADRSVFENGFASRGLLGTSTTSMDPNGQQDDDGPTARIALEIAHDYRGDLYVGVGVVDADYDLLCTEIEVITPDADDDGDNVVGELDVSSSECAAFLPPSPDQQWYVFAEDTFADDEGELLDFVVFDGENPYPAGGLPRLIPDGDPEGTFALVDGSGAVVAEGDQAMPGAPVAGQPFITIDITHSYNGDLSVRGGVADVDGEIVCSVPIQNPDPSDGSGGLIGDVDMSECGALYPPAPDRRWFLQVIDTAEVDVGTIDTFTVTGPDGEQFDFGGVPVDIPDDDVDGVALILDDSAGSNGTVGGGGQSSSLALPAVSIDIEHTFAGDLAVTAGVADADLNVLCEVVARVPDPDETTPDFVTDVSLSDCDRFYPPAPGQQWYLFVRDTLADDVGVVNRFTLTGPDGRVFDSIDPGTVIPDNDQNGVALFIDGSESMTAASDDVAAAYVITHSFVGDLFLEAGVVDASGQTLCLVSIREADPQQRQVDVAGTSDCAEFYPPAPDRIWFFDAIDTESLDQGTIDAVALAGPDGQTRVSDGAVVIPDDDPSGASVEFAR